MKLFTKKEDSFNYDLHRTCLTCGVSFQGKYCNRCGEKILETDERSLHYFFRELLNAFTFLDGKFPRSFKLLGSKPGELSANIVKGIRQPFMKPVSLFFVANFLYFFLPSFEVFNTTFQSQLESKPFGVTVESMVEERVNSQSMPVKNLEVLYNQNSGDWAKLLLVVIVILFSGILTLLNFSRSRFYSDHLTLSFEFLSYTILFIAIIFRGVTAALYFTGAWLGVNMRWLFDDERVFLLPTVSILMLYFLVRAQRTFYKNSWVMACTKSVALLVGFAGVIVIYRFILFLVTFSSL